MKDSQILSAFQPLTAVAPPAPEAPALVFDACHVGVVLRAVLFVGAVSGVAVMFGSVSFADWLGRLAVATGAALPATLAWLIIACSLKKPSC